LAAFFANDLKPTGSKDPFALRRATLGVISMLTTLQIRLPLFPFLLEALNALLATYPYAKETLARRQLLDAVNKLTILKDDPFAKWEMAALRHEVEAPLSTDMIDELFDFFADRLKVQQREAGVRHDLIDAVFALGGEDDLVRLLARVKALQAFVGTEDGVNLLAGYKRAANFLKSSPERGGGPLAVEGQSAADGAALAAPPPSRDGSPPRSGEELVELALLAALDTAEPLAAAAIEAEDFASAMTALASLRAPIDAFFEGVMVNDPDSDKRAKRLGLLTRFRDAVHRVADFSKIEG
jgi:glycyl-tRNA synthetase beta chain